MSFCVMSTPNYLCNGFSYSRGISFTKHLEKQAARQAKRDAKGKKKIKVEDMM